MLSMGLDETKPEVVIKKAEDQNHRAYIECTQAQSEPGITIAAEEAAQKEKRNYKNAKSDGSPDAGLVWMIFWKKQLRNLNTQIREQSRQVGGPHHGIRDLGDKRVLKPHRKK